MVLGGNFHWCKISWKYIWTLWRKFLQFLFCACIVVRPHSSNYEHAFPSGPEIYMAGFRNNGSFVKKCENLDLVENFHRIVPSWLQPLIHCQLVDLKKCEFATFPDTELVFDYIWCCDTQNMTVFANCQ